MRPPRRTTPSAPRRLAALGVLFAALALAVLAVGCKRKESPEPSAAPLRIAAAADLALAFEEVGKAFEAKTGRRTIVTFGSTGLLAKQIAEGAPFDVFAAANVSFVDELVQKGAALGDTKALYARGRIVIWTRAEAASPPASLADLADARFRKIAIANPEHAPYGRAAEQALAKAGILGAVKERLVYGENVRQALQFAQTGNVDAAIVALSLAIPSGGRYVPVDDALHAPLDQALVVCARSGDVAGARAFAAFVNNPEGRAIMRRFGFLLPGESVADAAH